MQHEPVPYKGLVGGQASETKCRGYESEVDTQLIAKPELGEVWLIRHENDADRAKVRSAFTFTNINALTSSLGEHLKNSYCILYERTIDFGSHPNEMIITSNIKIMDYISNYLNSDGIDNSLRTLAQVGVCVLLIFQEIFRERFELLGVSSELPKLREGL